MFGVHTVHSGSDLISSGIPLKSKFDYRHQKLHFNDSKVFKEFESEKAEKSPWILSGMARCSPRFITGGNEL